MSVTMADGMHLNQRDSIEELTDEGGRHAVKCHSRPNLQHRQKYVIQQ